MSPQLSIFDSQSGAARHGDPETSQQIFDAEVSEKLKQEGMDLAAENKQELLTLARRLAMEIAAKQGPTSIDDVILGLTRLGYNQGCLGNSAGSVFTEEFIWERVGYIRSRRTSNHSHLISLWKLKGQE